MPPKQPFTQAKLVRAMAAADKAGKTLCVRPDGSMIFLPKEIDAAQAPPVDSDAEAKAEAACDQLFGMGPSG